MLLSSSPPLQNLLKSPKFNSRSPSSPPNQLFSPKVPPLAHLHLHSSLLNFSPLLQTLTKTSLSLAISELFTSFPCFASETIVSSDGAVSEKINLEAILVSIDDFFNRNPFFVAGCTFIWLVVIPVAQYYLGKCKPISAIDAFRKLRNEPNAQLLDIRDEKTLVSLGSPNLKILSKSAVQVQFREGDEDKFVKKVMARLADPKNTVVCILDNFDGNSMKVAELLFKNGFKEAYAIRGGARGKNGWLEIQENLLPPPVHIYPKKKKARSSEHLGANARINQQTENQEGSSSLNSPIVESQRVDRDGINNCKKSMPDVQVSRRSFSPYPNYPDLKPPSSPTPSKP